LLTPTLSGLDDPSPDGSWFCRLGLDGAVPEHATFSKNRHGRFRDGDLLRHVFETVVQRCLDEGLVGGESFAADASLIHADANRQRASRGEAWEAHAIDPATVPRAVGESLAVLDDAAFGAARSVPPEFVAAADPAAQWTAAYKGHAFFAYAANYLVDLDHGVIVDVEASRAIRQAEVGAARTMVDRTMLRFDLYPECLVADSAYGSAPMLGWLVEEHGIEPHLPVFDRSQRRDGTFSRDDFVYARRTDTYRCPGGKTLTTTGTLVNDGETLHYRAATGDCRRCPLTSRCCPPTPLRKVPRSVFEAARDLARHVATTEAYATTPRLRNKAEMLFAHLKRILNIGRLRLRGPTGARDEFLLAATAQNLRKLAKTRPIPSAATAA
jgi:hypothetical protein